MRVGLKVSPSISKAFWLSLVLMAFCCRFPTLASADSFTVQYLPLSYENGNLEEGLVPIGINDLGQVVGYDGGQGYIYQNGGYTLFNDPVAQGTLPRDINNLGDVVGDAGLGGFLYDDGSFMSIMVPGSSITEPYSINDSGTIVGLYEVAGSPQINGFVYSNGTYTTVSYGLGHATELVGINDLGEIIGMSGDTISEVGFVYNGGEFSQIPFSGSDEQFTLTGVNNWGQISAEYWDGTKWNPVIYSRGTFHPVVLDGVSASSSDTTVKGINDLGQIIGQTAPVGTLGGTGYIGTPNLADAAEPSTITLLAIALALGILGVLRTCKHANFRDCAD